MWELGSSHDSAGGATETAHFASAVVSFFFSKLAMHCKHHISLALTSEACEALAVSTSVTWQRFASTGLPETLEDSQPGFGLNLKYYYNDSTIVVILRVDCYTPRERERESGLQSYVGVSFVCAKQAPAPACQRFKQRKTGLNHFESLLFQYVLQHSSFWLRGFHSSQILHAGTVQERVRTRAYFLYMDGCRDEKRNYFQARLLC